MFKRALCILLVLALSLACASTALADLTSVTDVEFETRPAYGVPAHRAAANAHAHTHRYAEPTATPEVTATPVPTATPTASPSPEPTHAPLSNGSRGAEVSALQNALTQLGFSTESADGIYGSRTEAAVSALQSYLMLLNARGQVSYVRLIDGMADSQLLKILLDDGVPAYYATLSDGSSGSQVTRLQKRLTSLDYMLDINVDGAFGPTTESAVKDFQRTNGLSATGIADSQTQNLLFSASAKKCTDPNIRYPYKLIVDVSDQYVYVYKYVNGSYSQYVRKFICSTGTKSDPTPLGTYRYDRADQRMALLHQVRLLGAVRIPHNRCVLLPLGAVQQQGRLQPDFQLGAQSGPARLAWLRAPEGRRRQVDLLQLPCRYHSRCAQLTCRN